MLPLHTLFLVSTNSMYLKKTRWFLWAIRTSFWPDSMPAKSHSFFLWLAMFNLTTMFELSTTSSMTDASGGRGGSYFPYILLNEIQTMFSQLAKRSARVLPADLCTDHAHYVKNHRSTVLRKNKNMAVEGGTVSHYYILVIRKFIDFMSLFRHSVWFSFSVKQFPFAEFGICNI